MLTLNHLFYKTLCLLNPLYLHHDILSSLKTLGSISDPSGKEHFEQYKTDLLSFFILVREVELHSKITVESFKQKSVLGKRPQ